MPEKLADDYGLTKLLAYLKAHCYKTGDGGSFQLATNDDIDNLVLTDVDEHDGPTWHEDTQSDTFDNTQAQFTWSDKRSVTKAIKRFHDLAMMGDQVRLSRKSMAIRSTRSRRTSLQSLRRSMPNTMICSTNTQKQTRRPMQTVCLWDLWPISLHTKPPRNIPTRLKA